MVFETAHKTEMNWIELDFNAKQDNSKLHIVCGTTKSFHNEGLWLLNWPIYSPDLSCKKHFRDY